MSSDRPIELSSLSLNDIAYIRKSLEEEIQYLENSLSSLQFVISKLAEAKSVLSIVEDSDEGKETFIPITSSLYVPGKLINVNKFRVDIGTGFSVEKTRKDAVDFYVRKLEEVNNSVSQLKQLRASKTNDLQQVEVTLQQKLQNSKK